MPIARLAAAAVAALLLIMPAPLRALDGADDVAEATLEAQEAPAALAEVAPYPSVGAFLVACQADLARHCADEPFRMAAMGACLRRDPEALSAPCRAQQEAIRARSEAIQAFLRPHLARAFAACADEVRSLCGEGRGIRGACLRVHQDRLTPQCATAEARLREAQQQVRRAPRGAEDGR